MAMLLVGSIRLSLRQGAFAQKVVAHAHLQGGDVAHAHLQGAFAPKVVAIPLLLLLLWPEACFSPFSSRVDVTKQVNQEQMLVRLLVRCVNTRLKKVC